MTIKLHDNPDYKDKSTDWAFSRAMYDGKREDVVSKDFLWPHRIEQTKETEFQHLFSDRANRTRYLNLDKMFVKLWTSFFFRSAPTANDAAQKLLGHTIFDMDGKGQNLASFCKSVLKQVLIYGKPIILVAKSSQAIESAEQDAKIRPVFQIIQPLDAKDWIYNVITETSIYKMFRYEYTYIPPRKSSQEEPRPVLRSDEYLLDGDNILVRRYQNETKDGEEPTWQLVGEIPLDLKSIPIASYECEPWLFDASQETLRFHNLRSNRDNILYHNGYIQKAISCRNPDEVKAGFSEYLILFLDEGSQLLSFSADNAEGYSEALRESISTAFKIALQRIETLPDNSAENRSAESINASDKNWIASIYATMQDIEDVINMALGFYAEFQGQELGEARIELDKQITDEDVTQFIALWTAFRDELIKNPTAYKEALARAVKHMNIDDSGELGRAIRDAAIIEMTTQARTTVLEAALNG